ncbi:MAG: IS21 family transposase, partial [Bacteroidales bacterium]|nr:IS21 family transposase [Bacteroidales bacterium]
REQFEKEELPYLLPLPPARFLFKYEKAVTINTTYHVQVDKSHFYSVPYQYVGKKAKVIYDTETVEVWVDFTRIAVHRRKYTDGYSTLAEHMPPNHLAYMKSKDINAAYLQSKASQIGPNTRASIDNILQSALFVQQSYRACQGVLRLALRYGADRVEAACQRIEPKTASTYKRIEAILKSNLDELPLMPSDMTPYIPANDNVRGASEYQ